MSRTSQRAFTNNMIAEASQVSDTSHEDMDHASTPMNSSFLSPIRKFDNLKLDESQSDVGDQTIDSDSDHAIIRRPVFVKRKRTDNSDIDMITPRETDIASSFSPSESTPCPAPAKKKLKFKEETPIKSARPPRLLDLSHSVKTSVDAIDLQLPQRESDEEWDDDAEVAVLDVQQSTPISQSTPANSRPPAPPTEQQSTFIHHDYQTPTARAQYHARKFEIVAEIAAEPEDEHIGDQRIDDPYLKAPTSDSEVELAPDMELRERYNSDRRRVPLLDIPLTKDGLLQALTKENLYDFYMAIKKEDEALMNLLRRERVRWHPDRWVGDSSVDSDIVEAIAMVVNGLISTHDYD